MKVGDAAIELVGFPGSHVPGFEFVARSQGVIISREVGAVCTMLIEEGYAMKSFRIHGKSCNWGPMAGFVVRDPRISKKGAGYAGKQEDAHQEAIWDTDDAGWNAGVAPIKISGERWTWLLRNNKKRDLGITMIKDFGQLLIPGQYDYCEVEASKGGLRIPLTIIEERFGVLGVYIDHGRDKFEQICSPPLPQRHQYFFEQSELGYRYEALLGMTNPYPDYSPPDHYQNVVTGDYDLFAVWPKKTDYRPYHDDRRLAGVMGNVSGRSQQIFQCEHVQIGNITDRLYLVAQMLNSRIGQDTGLPSRNVCYHSDEAGRPNVNEIDAPLIAFIPQRRGVVILGVEEPSKVDDLAWLVAACDKMGFMVTLHHAWANAIGLKRGVPLSPAMTPHWPGGGTRIDQKNKWYFPKTQVRRELDALLDR